MKKIETISNYEEFIQSISHPYVNVRDYSEGAYHGSHSLCNHDFFEKISDHYPFATYCIPNTFYSVHYYIETIKYLIPHENNKAPAWIKHNLLDIIMHFTRSEAYGSVMGIIEFYLTMDVTLLKRKRMIIDEDAMRHLIQAIDKDKGESIPKLSKDAYNFLYFAGAYTGAVDLVVFLIEKCNVDIYYNDPHSKVFPLQYMYINNIPEKNRMRLLNYVFKKNKSCTLISNFSKNLFHDNGGFLFVDKKELDLILKLGSSDAAGMLFSHHVQCGYAGEEDQRERTVILLKYSGACLARLKTQDSSIGHVEFLKPSNKIYNGIDNKLAHSNIVLIAANVKTSTIEWFYGMDFRLFEAIRKNYVFISCASIKHDLSSLEWNEKWKIDPKTLEELNYGLHKIGQILKQKLNTTGFVRVLCERYPGLQDVICNEIYEYLDVRDLVKLKAVCKADPEDSSKLRSILLQEHRLFSSYLYNAKKKLESTNFAVSSVNKSQLCYKLA